MEGGRSERGSEEEDKAEKKGRKQKCRREKGDAWDVQ